MPRLSLLITASIAAAVTAAAVIVIPIVEPTSEPLAAGAAAGGAAPIRVAVAGDSLSAGTDGFLGDGLGPMMWMTYADGGEVRYAGGYAHPGYTPDQIAEAIAPVRDVDVLVILAGTNAVRVGETLEQEEPAYERIVDTIHPEHVLIAAIPPYEPEPAAAVAYDGRLQRFATAQGWDWTDPWRWARTGTDGGAWRSGISVDGIHPESVAGYRRLGLELRRAIIAEAGVDTVTAAGKHEPPAAAR